MDSKMKFLVTGAAGFIGMHTSKCLLELGHRVIGIDNLNSYYDVNLKRARLTNLLGYKQFVFHEQDISNKEGFFQYFKGENVDIVINLAAQAGVRYSIESPQSYIDSNVTGFLNVLEACKTFEISHLLFASSSSIYGLNNKMPFSEDQITNKPAAIYGATKMANELMAHSYSHLFGLKTTGLRFFTVYGPWGRPDMALFKFVKAILDGEPIEIYNNGKMKRDFTYIDDIVDGIVKISLLSKSEQNHSCKDSQNQFEVFNIGNGQPIDLMEYIETIERILNRKAVKKYLPLQPGDIEETYADITKLESRIGPQKRVNINIGVKNFVDWYTTFTRKK